MWIPVKKEFPPKNGQYLCTSQTAFGTSVEICGFNNDLYELDDWDFFEFKDKHKQGFYDCDREYGYIYNDDVIAWQPLPEPYKEEEK